MNNIGELHAAFDDAIDAYVAFNNGPYDARDHRRHVRSVFFHAERLLNAFDAPDPEPRQPWILRRR